MHRDVLLLQGPIGPFFSKFAESLEQREFRVHKVNLNGGDRLFYRRPGAMNYSGQVKHWEAFLERLIVNKRIGRIYLFGDCRIYHRIAKAVAERNDVRVFVFEEGYIRPNFITLEENGVNGYSAMSRDDFVLSDHAEESTIDVQKSNKKVFALTAIYAMAYYWASALSKKQFPDYQHHRDFRWLPEGWRWIVSGMRKLRFKRKERNVINNLLPEFENNYFVCPLQVHCDMQVVVHSEYNSIEHFIGEVLTSFAKHAPSNKAIVFKHHPLDRGYTDYTNLFANYVSELGLQGRLFYVHDVCLPTLLKHAEGTIVINSTVGMSSLFHRTPVKTLGKAIYDQPGLTSQKSLKAFWQKPGLVQQEAFQRFRKYLIAKNQLNGNLYRSLSDECPSGLVWSKSLFDQHSYNPERIETEYKPKLRVVAGLDVSASPANPEKPDDAEAA